MADPDQRTTHGKPPTDSRGILDVDAAVEADRDARRRAQTDEQIREAQAQPGIADVERAEGVNPFLGRHGERPAKATLQDFVGWMKRDLGRFADLPVYIEAAGHGGHGVGAAATEQFVHIRIYTATNRYRFRAVERSDDEGYLGCQGSGRKPRAGANYTGGRDLHDGPLTEETWARILAEIVSYEMVRVQRNAVGSHLLGVPLRFWRSPPAGTRDDDRI